MVRQTDCTFKHGLSLPTTKHCQEQIGRTDANIRAFALGFSSDGHWVLASRCTLRQVRGARDELQPGDQTGWENDVAVGTSTPLRAHRHANPKHWRGSPAPILPLLVRHVHEREAQSRLLPLSQTVGLKGQSWVCPLAAISDLLMRFCPMNTTWQDVM